ncbi:epimerase [Actinorhabdospora filicis]|uniref:Epimerase n=1 Tax=Actinorhabdospora filicis TaxID=1785913 RepID=A0A9W6WAG5_9ACTN|nr:NAD-dependent epimerase/dehydratase family protein [Actinorhabdospora filicis]GLZ79639.1 epimerase [Actinorhabdospora filicis]
MAEVCVIGGTRFFGKLVVSRLIEEGHRVTLITRGRTPDPFGDAVLRRTADADSAGELGRAIGTASFDAVVHQVCYRPVTALAAAKAFTGHAGKLVVTSTMEVYNSDTFRHHRASPGFSTWAKEGELDPLAYGYDLGLPWDDPEFAGANYGEGKRQAESALAQSAGFPLAFARAAHVLSDRDEFTGRVEFLVERVLAGGRMTSFRDPGRTSLVHADDLARFLVWLALNDVTGPVNACSPDPVTLYEVLAPIEGAAGLAAVVEELDAAWGDPDLAPFSCPADYGMSVDLAAARGFAFTPAREWLRDMAVRAVAEARR